MTIQYDPPLSALMDFFCEGEHQGFPEGGIQEAETRLGVKLPPVYRDYLKTYGRDEINYHFNQLQYPGETCTTYEILKDELEDWGPEFQEAMDQDRADEYETNPYFQLWRLPPERWGEVTDNYVLIWFENQGRWSAGYRFKDLLDGLSDPPVYVSEDSQYAIYTQWTDNTEDFLIEMLHQAAPGWHGGQRRTWEANIQEAFSSAGIDWLTMRARGRPQRQKNCFLSSCLSEDGDTLYFYLLTMTGHQELCFARRRARPEPPQDPAKRNGSDPIQRESHLPAPRVYRPVRRGPYRLALLAHQKKDLGMEQPKPEAGIPLHPFIALLVQEAFNHEPATAYDWGKDLGRLKSLKLELRYGTRRAIEGDLAYIYPPGEHFPPPPYYFDLEDWSIVEKMTALRSVLVERILIEDAAFWSALKKLPNLKSLTISATQVQDFSFLSGCRQLTRLSLYNTNFSDCRLLLELPRLQQADLRFCPLEHTEVLEQLACKVLFPN